MPHRRALDRPVTEETYVELVRSLFTSLVPTSIMGILFIVVAGMATRSTPDPLLIILGVAGSVAALVRVAVLAACKKRTHDPELNAAQAAMPDRLFGSVYVGFAVLFGLFAGRACQVGSSDVQMVVAPLVVGYAAGVAAGVSLRPWICVPSVLFAVTPVITASLAKGQPANLILAFVLAALLAGGIGSMLTRYHSEIEKITMRQLFASLARQDHLTGLANRLCLSEAFARNADARSPGKKMAVHCLDLDRFKQVNDRHGHLAGDMLLKQAGERLRAVIRRGDTAGRLGGDEFVVLQSGVTSGEEAEHMARRIVRTLSEPYLIDGKQLNVGVSVGYAVPKGVEDLAHLLELADQSLYRAKRGGGGTEEQASGRAAAGSAIRLVG
ncbi:MAG: GGDEF domain-containing protein [Novosphingobium sp.]